MLFLTLGLSIAPFTQSVQAATINETKVTSTSKSGQTPSTYKNWLNEKIKNSKDASEKSDLKATLKQFESLSTSDQEKFVSYINNKEFIINALKTGTNAKNKKTVINSDVSITKDTVKEIEPKNSLFDSMLYSSDEISKKAQVSNTLEILGVDILKTTAWVRYHHNSSTVTSVDSANFVTSRNLLPGCSSSWSTPEKTIDDEGRAVATADITFTFLYKGWGPTIGSAEMGVRGDADENVDGWLTPYES